VAATREQKKSQAQLREEKLQRDQWILDNRTKINSVWSKMRGKKLTDAQFHKILGDPTDPDTKRLNERLNKYMAFEPWYDALKAAGITPKKFKSAEDTVNWYSNLERRFGTVGGMDAWLKAADDWGIKRGKEVDRLDKARSLQKKFGTVENYYAQSKINDTLKGLPDYIRKAFGDETLKKGISGAPGFERVMDEVQAYEGVYQVMKSQGMNTSNLSRGRVNSVVGKYGSAENYGKFLNAEDIAASYMSDYQKYAGYGFTTAPKQGDLAQQIYQGNTGSLQSEFEDYAKRLQNLYKPVGGGREAGAGGANQALGDWMNF
jgi:hypothetical protein